GGAGAGATAGGAGAGGAGRGSSTWPGRGGGGATTTGGALGLPNRSTASKSTITVMRNNPRMAGSPTLGVGAGMAETVRAPVWVCVDVRLPVIGDSPVAVILIGETMGVATSSISWAVRTRFFQSVWSAAKLS